MAKMDFLMLAGILFLILGLSPVSASLNKISPGDIIFIGECCLDVTDITNKPTQIAWFGQCIERDISSFKDGQDRAVYSSNNPPPSGSFDRPYCDESRQPDHILDISDPNNFFVAPDLFVGHTGDFYLWDGTQKGEIAFKVREPHLDLLVYDTNAKRIINDEPIPRGHVVNFQIDTNLGEILTRNGYSDDEAPISIKIEGPENTIIRDYVSGINTPLISINNLPVEPTYEGKKWYWIEENPDHSEPSTIEGWNTGALFNDCNFVYPLGRYSVWAVSNLNDMMDYYPAPDGDTFVGRTISKIRKFNLIKGDETEYNQCKKEFIKPTVNVKKSPEWTAEGIPPPTGIFQ